METRVHKRIKRFIRYLFVRALFFAVGLLPLSVAKALGAGFGRLAFRLAGGERRKALASLAIAFPEMSEAERATIARGAFAHLGTSGAEMCCLRQIDRRIEHYVELPDADRALLDAAVAEGHGIIFVSGHVGNFELLARRIAMAGYPSRTIAREASDPRTTAFIEALRASGKLRTVWRGRTSAARDMLRALKGGELLGMLIDQDTRVQGVFVDFFGRKAHTPRAAADLALRTGAAVVTGFVFRRPDGGHRIALGRIPLPPASGDREADALALTQELTRAIEAAVRAAPDTWVWMHQRWKTRPAEEQEARVPAADAA